MPEGAEVWCLSRALNHLGFNTACFGKHLFLLDKNEDWSFGLNGRVRLDDDLKTLHKIGTNISGKIACYNSNVYCNIVDFMEGSEFCIRETIENWIKTKRTFASLLLDQKQIAGIGVAWGSEILHRASVLPSDKPTPENVQKVIEAIFEIRSKIKTMYRIDDDTNCVDVVNLWCENLYAWRDVNIYKKGKAVQIGGRTWWV